MIREQTIYWHSNNKDDKPNVNSEVLIRHDRGAGGSVYDVACYLGKDEKTLEEQWRLNEFIKMDDKSILEWCYLETIETEIENEI